MTRAKREASRLKKRAIELVGKECAHCRAKRKLHFAHKQPTGLNGRGRGRKRRYKDVIKNPEAYLAAVC